MNFFRDDTGQDLVEYALVGALVAIASFTAIHSYSNSIANALSSISNSITSDT